VIYGRVGTHLFGFESVRKTKCTIVPTPTGEECEYEGIHYSGEITTFIQTNLKIVKLTLGILDDDPPIFILLE